MYSIIAFLMAVIPAVGLLAFYLRQDRARPEPKGLILKVFLFGVLSTFAAAVLEGFVGLLSPAFAIHPLLLAAFEAFLIAGLCEEGIKLAVVQLNVMKNPAFDEEMDGIIYLIVVSLGFACFENVLYVMNGGITVALVRAFTAVPLHAFASGLMGSHFGRARFIACEEERRREIRKGLLIAVGIHGTYDFLLFAQPVLGSLPLLLLIPLLAGSGRMLQKRIKEAKSADALRDTDSRLRWDRLKHDTEEN